MHSFDNLLSAMKPTTAFSEELAFYDRREIDASSKFATAVMPGQLQSLQI